MRLNLPVPSPNELTILNLFSFKTGFFPFQNNIKSRCISKDRSGFWGYFWKRTDLDKILLFWQGKVPCYSRITQTWSQGYKTFFMLNSAEHEISSAHKYKTIKKFSIIQDHISLERYFPAY